MTDTEKPTPRAAAERLLELDGKATEGPWFQHYCGIFSEPLTQQHIAAEMADMVPDVDPLVGHVPAVAGDTPTPQAVHDGTFIAESRTLAPAVARALIQAEDEIATLRQRLKEAEEALRDTDGIIEALDVMFDDEDARSARKVIARHFDKHGKDGG